MDDSRSSSNSSDDFTTNIGEQIEINQDLKQMDAEPSKPMKKRERREIMSNKLVMVFDQSNISYRDAVHILITAAKAFELNTKNFVINISSIHRYYENIRKKSAEDLIESFKESDLDAIAIR